MYRVDTASNTDTICHSATNIGNINGKSAYSYAQDGGYTGTEAEFAKKLAEKTPTKLPNPKSLIIYDDIGSAPSVQYDGTNAETIFMRKNIYVPISMNEDGTFTSGEKFRTITNYIGTGYNVFCLIDEVFIPLLTFNDDVCSFALTLSVGDAFFTYIVEISSDNTCSVDMIQTEIPTEEYINALIDAKFDEIGMAEEGAY